MAIICNIKGQYTLRDYIVISCSWGFASVELRHPSASENSAAFEVDARQCFNVREITGDGETVEYPDHLRVERPIIDADEQELANSRYPGAY